MARRLCAAGALLLLGLLVAFPLLRLVTAAAAGGAASLAAVLEPSSLASLVNTGWTSLAVTVLAVAAGATAALLTERRRPSGRHWLRLAMVAPLLVPNYVAAIAWQRAYGRSGLTDQLLGLTLPGLEGPAGIVLVLAVGATPLAYLVVAGGLAAAAEPDLERAARASGAGPLRAAAGITLPLLRPALVAAAVLSYAGAANAFGVPQVLGSPAGFSTLATRIYRDLNFATDEAAFTRVLVAACVLLALALVAATTADATLGRGRIRPGGPAEPESTGSGVVAGLPVLLPLLMLVGLPLVALVLEALTRAAGLPPTPANWTLTNFAAALQGNAFRALLNSLLLAALAATVTVAMGALVVIVGGRAARALGTGVTTAFAIAGSALAVAVLIAYGGWLRDTLALILIAYLAKFWALGHRPLAGAADRLSPDLYRAARVSGAGPLDVLLSVVMPLFRPVLAAAWLLVFVTAVHEVTMSSLLYGPGSETLAVVVLNLQQLGDPTVTSALAVLLTLLLALPAAALLALRPARRTL